MAYHKSSISSLSYGLREIAIKTVPHGLNLIKDLLNIQKNNHQLDSDLRKGRNTKSPSGKLH